MIVTDEWLDAEIAWYENRTTQHESLVKTYYALCELRDRRRKDKAAPAKEAPDA